MTPNRKAADVLSDWISIQSPEQLIEVALDVQRLIEEGLVREVAGNCSVFDIDRKKPWPADVIEIEFETIPEGTRYRLECETFHGKGGAWRRKDLLRAPKD